MRTLTKGQAIKAFCRECAGGPKDQLLCTAGPTCPLWPHRVGGPGELRRRMAVARRAYGRDLAELERNGIGVKALFEFPDACGPAQKSEKHQHRRGFCGRFAKNSARPAQDQGSGPQNHRTTSAGAQPENLKWQGERS